MSGDARPLVDREQLVTALRVLTEPGQTVELRAVEATTSPLDGRFPPRFGVWAGWFRDWEAAAREVGRLTAAKAVYVTLNPVLPDLYARTADTLRQRIDGGLTTDEQIIRRRWLLVDCDPARVAGVSATNDERTAARERARAIHAWLTGELGWPEPVQASSGNGYHLLFRVDLAADADANALVHRCLEALAAKWNDGVVTVDTTVSNAARICKLYGTLAAKGASTPERPHRPSKLLRADEPVGVVPREQLEALAALAPEAKAAEPTQPAPPRRRRRDAGAWQDFDLEHWLRDHQVPVGEPRAWSGGRKWVFEVCPFNSAHTDRSAFVAQRASGAIVAKCSHNSCSWDWRALRELYEPGCYDHERQERPAPAGQRPPPPEPPPPGSGAGGVDPPPPEPPPPGSGAEGRAGASRSAVPYDDEAPPPEPPANSEPVEELVVPVGWRLASGQLYRVKYSKDGEEELVLVSFRPPLLRGRYLDIESGDVVLECEYSDPPTTRKTMAPRDQWITVPGLRELTRQGVDAHAKNTSDVSRWVAECESMNARRLPYQRSTGRLGWHGNHRWFVLGDRVLGPPDGPRFVAPNVGEQQTASAIQPRGQLEEWARVVLPAALEFPRLLLCLVAAHAPVIQGVLDAPNFILELVGLTSTGKTTAAQVGLSAWGDPRNPGIRKAFYATEVSKERYLTIMGQGLPALLDDSQHVPTKEMAGATAYMVANGQGKGRGALRGSAASLAWRTVCFVTGERSLEETCAFHGVVARVLSLDGSPFGGHFPDRVRALTDGIAAHHGHSGPAFVAWLLSQPDWPARVREVYARWQRTVRKDVPGGSVMSRKVDYLALLLATAELLSAVLPWPLGDGKLLTDPLLELLVSWAAAQPERDQARESYESFVSWVAQHRVFFWDAGDAGRSEPGSSDRGEKLGVWRTWERNVAVFTHAARRWEAETRFPLTTSVRQWAERGWVVRDDDQNLAAKVRFPGGRCRAYVVKLEGDESSGPAPPPGPGRPEGGAEAQRPLGL